MAKFRGGMPGMGNMNQMIKQAQKMQEEMLKAQAEIEEKTLEASSGGGAVTVTINGKKELQAIKISPDAVDPDDVETLEDLILTAINEAMRQADELAASSMGRVTGGLNIPGLF